VWIPFAPFGASDKTTRSWIRGMRPREISDVLGPSNSRGMVSGTTRPSSQHFGKVTFHHLQRRFLENGIFGNYDGVAVESNSTFPDLCRREIAEVLKERQELLPSRRSFEISAELISLDRYRVSRMKGEHDTHCMERTERIFLAYFVLAPRNNPQPDSRWSTRGHLMIVRTQREMFSQRS
jgi:hypothetical protein